MKKYDYEEIRKMHGDFLSTMSLPAWIPQLICVKCQKAIGFASLRDLGLKLNAQHVTNFFITICCQHCSYAYEFDIENKCKNLQEFIDFLKLNNHDDTVVPGFEISPTQNNLLNIVLKK